MSVEVNLNGRLGNNLFQYALGRIVAEELGYQLTCTRIREPVLESFPGLPLDVGDSISLEESTSFFSDIQLVIVGKKFQHPVESYDVLSDRSWSGHVVDLDAILSNRNNRMIRLDGFFQRAEYFSPFRSILMKWMCPSSRYHSKSFRYNVGDRDVLVNIRRGADFGLSGWTLPLSYYDTALKELDPVGRVYICGTSIDEEVQSHMERYSPIYIGGTPLEQFSAMMRFPCMILSNSTFCWWPAFLSDCRQVYAPRSMKSNRYSYSGYGDVDLSMVGKAYKEIQVHDFQLLRVQVQPRVRSFRITRQNTIAAIVAIMRSDGEELSFPIDHYDVDFTEGLLSQRNPVDVRSLQVYPSATIRRILGALHEHCCIEIRSYYDSG